MFKFTNLMSLTLLFALVFSVSSMFNQEAYAGTKNEVRQQCKRGKYTKGTWKLRIDSIDRETNGFTANTFDRGSAYYMLRFANGNGTVKWIGNAADHHTGATNVSLDTAETYMVVGKAENTMACQVGVSLLAYHYTDNTGSTLAGAVDFVGLGYNDAHSLNPNSQGEIDLHNSIVYYYDTTVGAWSGAKRAKASLVRLQDK